MHPTDDQLEATAQWLDDLPCCEDGPRETTERCIQCERSVAEMLRACKGRARVKPLEWHGGSGNYPRWHATGLAFTAKIERHSWQGDYGLFIDKFAKGAHDTLEAAKAAAQADYEARILYALEHAPDHSEWNAAIEAAAAVANQMPNLAHPSEVVAALRALKKGPRHD